MLRTLVTLENPYINPKIFIPYCHLATNPLILISPGHNSIPKLLPTGFQWINTASVKMAKVDSQ